MRDSLIFRKGNKMKYNRYTVLGLLFSLNIFIFLAIMGLDYVYFDMKIYHFFISNVVIEYVSGILLVISYLCAPFLLLFGYYKEKERRINLIIILPFLINVTLFLFGSLILFWALDEIVIRPLIIALGITLFYIISIVMIKKKAM